MGILRHIWNNYYASAKMVEVLVECRPSSVLFVVGAMWVVSLTCGFVPVVHQVVQLDAPYIPIILAGCGGAFSLLSYFLNDRKRTLTTLFILFDTSFYAAAALSCAILSDAPSSYIFGGVYVVMTLHWGRAYAFSWLGLLFFTIHPLLGIIAAGADLPLALIVFMGGVIFVFTSLNTQAAREREALGKRREITIEQLSQLLNDSYSESLSELRTDYGVMLHQVKNDLHPALMGVEMAFMEIECGRAPREDLEVAREGIFDSIERIKSFMKQTSSFSVETSSFRLSSLKDEFASIIPRAPVDSRRLIINDLPTVEVKGSLDNAKVVIRNLINNAFESGATRVVLDPFSEEDKYVSIFVRDNGSGIPSNFVEKLFDPYFTHGKKSGTGLGLFICKNMMGVIGGSISMVRTGPSGTTFELRFAKASK